MWVYKQTGRDPVLHTVGFYDPAGMWHADSDHVDAAAAADRVNYLNGGHRVPTETYGIRRIPRSPNDDEATETWVKLNGVVREFGDRRAAAIEAERMNARNTNTNFSYMAERFRG